MLTICHGRRGYNGQRAIKTKHCYSRKACLGAKRTGRKTKKQIGRSIRGYEVWETNVLTICPSNAVLSDPKSLLPHVSSHPVSRGTPLSPSKDPHLSQNNHSLPPAATSSNRYHIHQTLPPHPPSSSTSQHCRRHLVLSVCRTPDTTAALEPPNLYAPCHGAPSEVTSGCSQFQTHRASSVYRAIFPHAPCVYTRRLGRLLDCVVCS